ncbi:MAG: MBOAT family O-acyltransferase [Chitinophagaceae bacterium]
MRRFINRKEKTKKIWLLISIAANIGLLSVFKYYNFFITNFNEISGSHFVLLHWILPIGLSFHTFQSISYTIEVYRGNQKAVRHFGYYALYVMFYPQLVAGPIERPYNMFPQFFRPQRFSWQHIYEGLRLMTWGFLKKTVIADRVGDYVDAVFTNPSSMNAANIWLGILFFSIQIYADFSGYSDIATGSARCMGYNLMINFNRPYSATNIRDFWKKWHISLSSWFRDYVYIPLGGNRKGKLRKNINMMITFILSGLWHGAGWTFVIWGALHGAYMWIYEQIKKITGKIKIAVAVGWLATCSCVGFAWIFFRAGSLQNAFAIIRKGLVINNITFQSFTASQHLQYHLETSHCFLLLLLFYMYLLQKILLTLC